VTDYRLNRRL